MLTTKVGLIKTEPLDSIVAEYLDPSLIRKTTIFTLSDDCSTWYVGGDDTTIVAATSNIKVIAQN